MGYLETLTFGGDEQGIYVDCNRCKSPLFYGFNPMNFDELMEYVYDHRCVTFKPVPILTDYYKYSYGPIQFHSDLLSLLAKQ